eukprot:Awhi_evm1s4982
MNKRPAESQEFQETNKRMDHHHESNIQQQQQQQQLQQQQQQLQQQQLQQQQQTQPQQHHHYHPDEQQHYNLHLLHETQYQYVPLTNNGGNVTPVNRNISSDLNPPNPNSSGLNLNPNPPDLDPNPPDLNPSPSELNPNPPELNPNPPDLHPDPSDLHPNPTDLNSSNPPDLNPSNPPVLNPNPSDLNPNPPELNPTDLNLNALNPVNDNSNPNVSSTSTSPANAVAPTDEDASSSATSATPAAYLTANMTPYNAWQKKLEDIDMLITSMGHRQKRVPVNYYMIRIFLFQLIANANADKNKRTMGQISIEVYDSLKKKGPFVKPDPNAVKGRDLDHHGGKKLRNMTKNYIATNTLPVEKRGRYVREKKVEDPNNPKPTPRRRKK